MSHSINPPVTLQPVDFLHAQDVQRYASDARVAELTNIPHPYPADGGRAFVERAIAGRVAGTRYAFAILSNGSFAGIVTLNAVDREAGTAELDYWVAVPFWNQGIGTAAVSAAVQYAFGELGLSLLRSACLPENRASARVLEKNEFQKADEFVNDGKYGEKFVSRKMSRFILRPTTKSIR